MSTVIDELFLKTLVGDYDGDEAWEAVCGLRRVASDEVFETALVWCHSEHPLKRARGADVLAQFGKTVEHPSHVRSEAAYAVVSDVLEHETEVRPLSSAIFALGHIGDARAVPLIARFVQHPDAEVRFAVACALGDFPNDERGAKALMALTDDVDDNVRDWATFGLGAQGDLDSPEIRDVLVERLTDSFDDVRQEAMAALGKRRDIRVLPNLLRELQRPAVSGCILEAAYLMLGFERAREGWKPQDYLHALSEQFGTEHQERQPPGCPS